MSEVAVRDARTAQVLGPWGQTRTVPKELEVMSVEKMRALYRSSPWLERLESAVGSIVRADVTHKKRLKMLRSLADKINEAVAGQSACRRGCDACCKIQVEMTDWEARVIGEELGIKVKEPAVRDDRGSPQRALELMGRPCGFLKGGECSIYASRPVACRLHHSLNADAAMCQPTVNPEDSMVPTLNLTVVHIAYAICSGTTLTGDIAEFFDEAARGPSEVQRLLKEECEAAGGASA